MATQDVGFTGGTQGRADVGAMVAGALVTVAVGITLLALGAAIGLTSIDPTQGDWGGRGLWMGGGAWTMLSIVVSTLAGAMASVRFGGAYTRSEAGAQGLGTWAFAFIGGVLFTTWFTTATAAVAGLAANAGANAVSGNLPPEVARDLREQAQELTSPREAPAEAVVPGVATPSGEQAAEAAEAGAWAGWGFFVTAVLAALAGMLGGVWGLPGVGAREESPGPSVREPLRPLDV